MLLKICRNFARKIKQVAPIIEPEPAQPSKPKLEIPQELRKIGIGKKELTPEILELVRFT
jgi:hypothetical protein